MHFKAGNSLKDLLIWYIYLYFPAVYTVDKNTKNTQKDP